MREKVVFRTGGLYTEWENGLECASKNTDDAHRLHPRAGLVFSLQALYAVAESLCSVFVSMYFYVNSLDFRVVCYYYLALYTVTPVVFALAGWYAKTRDRTEVFRIGLILHAVYYATLLWLRESSADHAVALGALLGVTWGFFWAGNNTMQFDFSTRARRDYYVGLLSTVSGAARLCGPLLSGAIIEWAPGGHRGGYQAVFATALLLYLAAVGLSLRVPHDHARGASFRLWPALFPPREHRNWRLIQLASATLGGSTEIFHFVLALVLFMQTRSELNVGGFVAFQALAGVVAAYLVGRLVTPRTRMATMTWGVAVIVAAGAMIACQLSLLTLILFGFLRSISEPLFGIPHTGIRYDVMEHTAPPENRIEYICAWEFPLAFGRLVTMLLLVALYAWLGETGLRIMLVLISSYRIATLLILRRISFVD